MQRYQSDEQETQGERIQQEHSANMLIAPVVIVGAGPTGLAAANLLGMAGIQTILLERKADLVDCPRAISIDDEGLRICQAMGLSNEVIQHMMPDIIACYVSGKNYLARVSPTSRRNGYPLISTFHQPTFEAILLNGLDRFPCVSVHFQHTLEAFEQDDVGVTLQVRAPDERTLRIRCRYLLACDGGQSHVRHALSIPMRAPSVLPSWLPRRYFSHSPKFTHKMRAIGAMDQRWISIDCVEYIHDGDDTPTMPRYIGYFFSDYKRPAVSVPTPFSGRRWEFLMHPHERPEEMLDDDTLYTLMQQTLERAPQDICPSHEAGAVSDRGTSPGWNKPRFRIIRRAVYTFHTVIADRFSHGRVFLLGDAAHMMPPFTGQGMNSGLRDAHNLCWKLRLVLCDEAHPRLLNTYFEERAPHVKQMALFTSLPGKLLTTTVRPFSIVRDWLFRGLNSLPMIRKAITEMRVKPASRYVRGFFRARRNESYKKFIGTLLPQPRITTLEGNDLLLDEVLGDSFALICSPTIYRGRVPGIETNSPAINRRTTDTWLHVVHLYPSKHKTNVLPSQLNTHSIILAEEDCEQPLSLLFHNPRLCLLVRPDRYILDIFDRRDTRRVADMLSKMLYE